jgi:hypothetical protein
MYYALYEFLMKEVMIGVLIYSSCKPWIFQNLFYLQLHHSGKSGFQGIYLSSCRYNLLIELWVMLLKTQTI